jgi:hypothetical protein
MEPATRRPAPEPLSGTASTRLHAQAKGSSAQSTVVKPTASTGEQAASSGRKRSYAEVGAAYAGVVAGRQVKGANSGVDPSATFPTIKGASQESKRGRDEKASRGNPPASKSPRREKDITVCTTAGGHLGDHPAAPLKPIGTLKPTAKCISSAPVPAASNESASRRTSPGATGDVSWPLSVTPIGTTSTTSGQSRSTRGATQ